MMWLGTAFGYEQEFSHADLAMKWRRGVLERNVVLLCRYLGMHKAREENIGLAQQRSGIGGASAELKAVGGIPILIRLEEEA